MIKSLLRTLAVIIFFFLVFMGVSFIRGNSLKPLERVVDVNLLANQQSGKEYLEFFHNSKLNNEVYEDSRMYKDFDILWEIFDATTPTLAEARIKILSGIMEV
jgi:hypothetical protein